MAITKIITQTKTELKLFIKENTKTKIFFVN